MNLTNVEVIKSSMTVHAKIIPAKHCGTMSPVANVEKFIVSILQQMAKMLQPLNVSDGSNLANVLVGGILLAQWFLEASRACCRQEERLYSQRIARNGQCIWIFSKVILTAEVAVGLPDVT